MDLYKLTDIKWDCDGADPKEYGLPIEKAEIESEDIEDVINDLSDEWGWCISHVSVIYRWENDEWVDVSDEC